MHRRAAGPGAAAGALILLLTGPAPAQLEITAGPLLLRAGLHFQWGGHTFSYAVCDEQSLYWAAKGNAVSEGAADERLPELIRQPRRTLFICRTPLEPGAPPAQVQAFELPERMIPGSQPVLLRTPDGYLHLILGGYRFDPAATEFRADGLLRYYRSAAPGDVSRWLDRTERLPDADTRRYHLRLNAAVSRDGGRAALVVLSAGGEPQPPFNTPQVLLARRDGLDFRFAPPLDYAPPQGLFYPLVALLDDAVVIVGEVWDDATHATSRLLVLDGQGRRRTMLDLPALDAAGRYLTYDLRPEEPGDWRRLVLAHTSTPDAGRCRHQLLRFDPATLGVEEIGSFDVDPSHSNAGRWIALGAGRGVFVNNPSMGALCQWRDGRPEPLPGCDPLALGLAASAYVQVPSPFQGSLEPAGRMVLLSDCFEAGRAPDQPGPASLLAWVARAR